jgi:dTDP-4-dehydrorhamnose 3,5-epimerase
MDFTTTRLKGAFLVSPTRIADHRGYFGRGFCRDEFSRHGLNPNIAQLNIGFSHQKGTLRGLHYQVSPHEEAKFVRCTRGALFDVVVDLRRDSPTRGKWFGADLTPENGLMMYVPEGCAHGYQTLTDDTEMYYSTSAPYSASASRGARYDDPAFGISWPIPVAVISDTDAKWPDYLRDAST